MTVREGAGSATRRNPVGVPDGNPAAVTATSIIDGIGANTTSQLDSGMLPIYSSTSAARPAAPSAGFGHPRRGFIVSREETRRDAMRNARVGRDGTLTAQG